MRSMTGYAHMVRKDKKRKYDLSVTAINSRFLDIHIYLPMADALLEARIRDNIKKQIARGKVNLKLSWESLEEHKTLLKLNENVLEQCIKECRTFSRKTRLTNDVSIKDLISMPFAWNVYDKKESDLNYRFIDSMVKEALKKLSITREKEGQRLRKRIISYINGIKKHINSLKSIRKEQTKELNKKLKTKLVEINKSDTNNKSAIEREIKFIILKGDIEEEIVRLESHIIEMERILDEKDSIGKKMGFMVQELTRECNTIGDKLMHVRGKHIALNCKMLIEKIREQLQNIE
ncbi:YicC/YloC family endoribonuclease [bacterium]